MDAFGIGSAIRGVVEVYFRSARNSGRTVELVNSLRSGDRVIFTNNKEANRVGRMCRERGLDVECRLVETRNPQKVFELGPPSMGRTIFDHSWVEEFYLQEVKRAQRDIDHLQKESSGYGEAHLKTRKQAEEALNWRF